VLAAKVQKNRYQDMVFRLSRNEAMSKYQSAFNHAARYAWLAASAYDLRDQPRPRTPGGTRHLARPDRQGTPARPLERTGEPQIGQGGLAEILRQLNGNFQVLKGQLGINNPQSETGKISLRQSCSASALPGNVASDGDRWKDATSTRASSPDLTKAIAGVRPLDCRPFVHTCGGPQPGIGHPFHPLAPSSSPVNFFGQPLIAGDHSLQHRQFRHQDPRLRGLAGRLQRGGPVHIATRLPRADRQRLPAAFHRRRADPRLWSVVEQRIPTPFVINQSRSHSPGFIPTLEWGRRRLQRTAPPR
jgi:hypothetical protein